MLVAMAGTNASGEKTAETMDRVNGTMIDMIGMEAVDDKIEEEDTMIDMIAGTTTVKTRGIRMTAMTDEKEDTEAIANAIVGTIEGTIRDTTIAIRIEGTSDAITTDGVRTIMVGTTSGTDAMKTDTTAMIGMTIDQRNPIAAIFSDVMTVDTIAMIEMNDKMKTKQKSTTRENTQLAIEKMRRRVVAWMKNHGGMEERIRHPLKKGRGGRTEI